MRSKPEFRCVCLADDERPGSLHCRDHVAVGIGYIVRENRRSVSGSDACGVGQILDGYGQSIKRTARTLFFEPGGICKDVIPVPKRDDGIDQVVRLNSVKKGCRDLAGGGSAGHQFPRQAACVHLRQIGHGPHSPGFFGKIQV